MAVTTAAVIGAGLAAKTAHDASSAAKKAGKQQEKGLAGELAVQREGLQAEKDRFADIKGTIDPFISGFVPPEVQVENDRARLIQSIADLDRQDQEITGPNIGPEQSRIRDQRAALHRELGELPEATASTLPLGAKTGVEGAFNSQQALSGALGADRQAEAFQNFQDSPGVQFLREQGLRGVDQRSASSGGLGGGERLKALTEFSQGLALQDFGNQFNRLGSITGTGLQAAQALGGISGQSGVTQAGQFAQQAGTTGQIGQAQALTTLSKQQARAQGNEQIIGGLTNIAGGFA
jgi:hypothetical protein